MEINIHRIERICFTCKANGIHFHYDVRDVSILRTDCIKDLGVMLESKLYFLCHVDFVYSQALRTLRVICYITIYLLNCLNFRTFYSRQRHLYDLFLINVFKGKINCHSIMDTIGIRMPTRQIREFSFSVSKDIVLQLGEP
jgi:hypothetical protein